MAAIRSSATRPEKKVIQHLRHAGFRVVPNRKDLPGRPDAVIPSARAVVFVHGCFWHQHGKCPDSRLPQSNAEYWTPKLTGNKRRDARRKRQLRRMGWHVFVIWDCEVTPIGLARLERRIGRSLVNPLKSVGSLQQPGTQRKHKALTPQRNLVAPEQELGVNTKLAGQKWFRRHVR